MDYSIDFSKPLEDQVRLIARHRLEAAADMLKQMPDGADKAIHGARKHIKQCRALYRLVASCADEFQARENERLRTIAGQLSALRDAAALGEVTQYLKHEIVSKSNAMLMDRLAKRIDTHRQQSTHTAADIGEIMQAAKHDLQAAAKAVDDIDLPHGNRKSAECVADGWEKVSKKARRALDPDKTTDDEAFHDLRKRCQDRWMHAALIRNIWPGAMGAMHGQAKALSDSLGHVQDLTVLREALTKSRELAGDGVEHEALREAISTQSQKLQGECRDAGSDLFRKAKPRDGAMISKLIMDL